MNETIYQELRRLVASGLDPEEAATEALTGKRTRRNLADWVRPEVLRLAKGYARGHVRRLEHRVFSGSHHQAAARSVTTSIRSSPPVGGGTRPDAVRHLVRDKIFLPDGKTVEWGKATPEQHEARAGWLRRQAGNLATTAGRHMLAAGLIREKGVSCLDEIPDWAVLLDERRSA